MFVELQSGIPSPQFTAVGLTAGLTYSFRVQQRTSFAISTYSSSVSILAAEKPAQPEMPVLSLLTTAVHVTWQAPNEMGSALVGYSLEI